MATVHRGLSDKLDVLLGEVKDNDWQIALTTTDPRDCPHTIISAATPNYERVFRHAVNALELLALLSSKRVAPPSLGYKKTATGKRGCVPIQLSPC